MTTVLMTLAMSIALACVRRRISVATVLCTTSLLYLLQLFLMYTLMLVVKATVVEIVAFGVTLAGL